MKKINQTFTILTILSVFTYACGGSEAAGDKMEELKALKAQQKEISGQIADLEKELKASGELKSSSDINEILVSTIKLEPVTFTHKVEVRGAVDSKKDVLLSAETMGRISSINVKEGQRVNKGQVLVQLDADIIRNNINEVKTQLELATTISERQSKLWEQNIGTEVQYLQAKNNKESLESKLATLNAQLRQSNVYAPFSGTIDNIPARVGEMAQPGMPLLRIVSQDDMYITADVSESFLGQFSEGQEAEVHFPSQDKTIKSKVLSVGQVIKSENRTFEIEVKLPTVDFEIKPNQVVVLTLMDYQNKEALVVPTKLVQSDSKGSYVYEIVNKEGVKRANKLYVTPGVTYQLRTEIVKGLKSGQTIANDGYRELTQDVVVSSK
ncbi:MAG: efflux RND transporter periplasmic adaptor subunit [Marinoscillum sp.]